ncbi:hypothetical protein GGR58DRAFT_453139 [Xylaria digitata]|nr:hypothetical protein GGR58DRAFT_453139 [Xylaria digitata]
MYDGSWSASAPCMCEAHLAQMEAILGKMSVSPFEIKRLRPVFDGEFESANALHRLLCQAELMCGDWAGA